MGNETETQYVTETTSHFKMIKYFGASGCNLQKDTSRTLEIIGWGRRPKQRPRKCVETCECVLHAHFLGIGCERKGVQLCAQFDFSAGRKTNKTVEPLGSHDFNFYVKFSRNEQSGHNEPMLVGVGQDAQSPHYSTCGRASVRLILLDECVLRGVGYRDALTNPAPEVLAAFSEWERDLAAAPNVHSFNLTWRNESPSEIVKRASQVMNNLTNQDTNFGRENRNLGDKNGSSGMSIIKIFFEINQQWITVGISNGVQFVSERFNLLIGPANLCPTANQKTH